jgi:hypothetical protein
VCDSLSLLLISWVGSGGLPGNLEKTQIPVKSYKAQLKKDYIAGFPLQGQIGTKMPSSKWWKYFYAELMIKNFYYSK